MTAKLYGKYGHECKYFKYIIFATLSLCLLTDKVRTWEKETERDRERDWICAHRFNVCGSEYLQANVQSSKLTYALSAYSFYISTKKRPSTVSRFTLHITQSNSEWKRREKKWHVSTMQIL